MFAFLNGLIVLLLDILFGNGVSPAPPAPVVMSPRRLLQYQRAIRFSENVFFADLNNLDSNLYTGETFTFADSNDKAIVTHTPDDNTCYAAFSGAQVRNIQGTLTDGMQSAGIFGNERVCDVNGGGCCHMDRGIVGAYYSDYVAEFEATVRTCVASCVATTGSSCELVLTGHSQGGAIAQVAAVALADVNPLLMIYGAQKVLAWWHQPFCHTLNNMETFYRTVAQCPNPETGEPMYDVQSAYLGVPWGRHTGTMLLVSAGGAATLAHNRDVSLWPVNDECHHVYWFYIVPIDQLSAGPLDGLVAGSTCTRNIECHSQNCASNLCA